MQHGYHHGTAAGRRTESEPARRGGAGFDFAELSYLSSAGVRVLLGAQKTMAHQNSMILKNINETIVEVFEITGFVDNPAIQ